MAEITGGEVLARCLAVEGVRLVFGLPCPEVDPLLAALEPHGMRFVPIRHEGGGRVREDRSRGQPGHAAGAAAAIRRGVPRSDWLRAAQVGPGSRLAVRGAERDAGMNQVLAVPHTEAEHSGQRESAGLEMA